MELLKAALFGVIQGLTEFLPVSSSGHLAVFNKLFGYAPEEEFLFSVIAVHAATLLAVLIVFRRDIASLFTSKKRLIVLLIIGTIPAGLFGLLARHLVESATANMTIVGMGFLVTAFFLLTGNKLRKDEKTMKNISVADSISIGLAQALSILPGISRSGSTIAMAQTRSVTSDSAARFSFLLMIPAVGGATLLDMKDIFTVGIKCDALLVGVSFIAALAVGIVSLKLLLGLLAKGRFFYFSYYLIPLGLLCMLLSIFS